MSLLSEQEPAFCIQVLRHLGRTFGQGASGIGVSLGGWGLTTVLEVDEVWPPVGVLDVHLPLLSSSSALHDGAAVVETCCVVEDGTHLPSFITSPCLHETDDVVEIVVVAGVDTADVVGDETPPVGPCGTQAPFSTFSPSLQTSDVVVGSGVELDCGTH